MYYSSPLGKTTCNTCTYIKFQGNHKGLPPSHSHPPTCAPTPNNARFWHTAPFPIYRVVKKEHPDVPGMYDDYIIRFRVRNHDDVIPPSDVRTLCRETIRQTNPDKYISYLLNTWKDHSFIPMMPSRRHLFHSGYIFFCLCYASVDIGTKWIPLYGIQHVVSHKFGAYGCRP